MTKQAKQEQAEAVTRLREILKPGDTVHTILRTVSRSGMQRTISAVIVEDGIPHDYSFLVAQATGSRLKDGAVVMGGCGMDMGFALVHELSYALFGKGYTCTGKGSCPSNYHTNHRDTIRCEAGCYAPSVWSRYPVPDDWPMRTIELAGEVVLKTPAACISRDANGEDLPVSALVPCPTCDGIGTFPNPEGPERFDLMHTDGYALRHRWI